MPIRRGSRRGGSQAGTNRRRGQGGIRKNTRSRQPPSRYGQETEPNTEENHQSPEEESGSDQGELSEYENSTIQGTQSHTLSEHIQSSVAISLRSTTPIPPTLYEPSQQATPSSSQTLNIEDMRELLRSHEEEIVDRVFLRLNAQNHGRRSSPARVTTPLPNTPRQPPESNETAARIIELERQLAALQQREFTQGHAQIGREAGMYNPISPLAGIELENASATAESVERLFPGVERSTLAQIIENRFKPTNIYRLLATEKDRAESQRTINIGGVEFEQTERDGKESEYRMSAFFKAWAAYSGILVKLAPFAHQGDLATALFIYTMNLYELLEKYTWDGVKAYHFQFHRKRIAGGKGIFLPQEWQQLDSELIASKCFTHGIQRIAWSQHSNKVSGFPHRTSDLQVRENPFEARHNFPAPQANQQSSIPGRHLAPNPACTSGVSQLESPRVHHNQLPLLTHMHYLR